MITDEKTFGIRNIENVPACEEGVVLAADFMAACSRAVELVSIEEIFTLRSDFHFKFSKYAAHHEGCDKCNEV
jgi:hypothetical protein